MSQVRELSQFRLKVLDFYKKKKEKRRKERKRKRKKEERKREKKDDAHEFVGSFVVVCCWIRRKGKRLKVWN